MSGAIGSPVRFRDTESFNSITRTQFHAMLASHPDVGDASSNRNTRPECTAIFKELRAAS
jgi:hypothetical protein